MTSGLSTGSLPSTSLRPNETCTPSKPSCAASGIDCGSAPSLRFQSVTPMRSLLLAARPARVTSDAAARERMNLRRVKKDTGVIVVLSGGQCEHESFHSCPIVLVAFAELLVSFVNEHNGLGETRSCEEAG